MNYDTPDPARRRSTARAIIAALKLLDLNQNILAAAWGISTSRLNHLIHGRRPMHPVEALATASLLAQGRATVANLTTPEADLVRGDLNATNLDHLHVITPRMVERLDAERGAPRDPLPTDPAAIRALAEAAR